jgi:hypothetical protein
VTVRATAEEREAHRLDEEVRRCAKGVPARAHLTPEGRKACTERYYTEHKDEFRAHGRTYDAGHREERRLAAETRRRSRGVPPRQSADPDARAKRRKSRPRYDQDKHLQANYGISLADYDRLVMLQCGACSICGVVPSEDPDAKGNTGRLHVDHDHEVGTIRGLLCCKHNRGLGLFDDDADQLTRAAAYVKETGVMIR